MRVHVGGNESYSARVLGGTSIKTGMSAPIVIREYGDPYEGPTTVVPSGTTQTLSTRGKTMATDVTVEPIPSNYGLITWNGAVLTVS